MHLLILESTIRSKLVILASAYGKPTYLEVSTDIKQHLYRKWRYASHIRIKDLTKMIDRIKLDYTHNLLDGDISKDNQSDEIICGFMSE